MPSARIAAGFFPAKKLQSAATSDSKAGAESQNEQAGFADEAKPARM